MKPFPLLALLALAACGKDPAGPKAAAGLDPIVLVKNQTGPTELSMTWFDQSGQKLTTVVGIGQTACIKFTSTTPADSVRFIVAMGTSSTDTSPPPYTGNKWVKQWSPWFDPKTGLVPNNPVDYPFGAEFWTLDVPSTWFIYLQPVQTAPC